MATKIYSFRDLKVWQNGIKIAKEIYTLTGELPKEEMFGLVSQMRRAAVSISSNIAEGRGRSTRKDFCQFLHVALGSLSELETQLIIANEIFELNIGRVQGLINEEQRMVSSMLKKLKANS